MDLKYTCTQEIVLLLFLRFKSIRNNTGIIYSYIAKAQPNLYHNTVLKLLRSCQLFFVGIWHHINTANQ